MAAEIGLAAPEFSLVSNKGEKVDVGSFKGQKRVVLAFFPLAFTGG